MIILIRLAAVIWLIGCGAELFTTTPPSLDLHAGLRRPLRHHGRRSRGRSVRFNR